MAKGTILIVTNEEFKNTINITNYKVEVLKTKVDNTLIKKLNKSLYDTYQYIVFVNGCTMYKNLTHYIPINWEENCENKIFVNEVFLNPIIINNIKLFIDDERSIIELAVVLKHIVKTNITIDEFNLSNEIENIRILNNFEKINNDEIMKNIYKSIKQHYSHGDFFRKINFEIKKNKIVKMFLYKVLDNIIEDIKKNTNRELVFKELVSIII